MTIIDILRRANIEVKVSKVGEDPDNLDCIMSRGVKLVRPNDVNNNTKDS